MSRSGAAGLAASEIVARANPARHTLILLSSSFSVNPVLHKNLSSEPIRDFAPVVRIGRFDVPHSRHHTRSSRK